MPPPAITYRTTGPWGAGVGHNLTAADVDTNFWNTVQSITDLLSDRPEPNQIVSVTVTGTQMTVHMQDGTFFGPIPLPVLAFRWLGDWNPSTAYLQLDAFRVAGQGLYFVLVNHTSALTFDEHAVDGSSNPLYYKLFEAQAAGLAGLSDVQLSGLTNGQVIEWNATDSKWENVTLPGFGGLDSLTDVTISSPTNGQVLKYDTGTSQWINSTDADTHTIAAMTDVVLTGIADTQVLAWHAATSKFINVNAGSGGGGGGALASLSDVAMSGLSTGQLIHYNGSSWVNFTATVALLADVNFTSLADKQFMQWDQVSGRWLNIDLNLGNLHNVDLSAAADTYVLAFHAATSKWIAVAPGGSGAGNLVSLSDVAVSSPASGQSLVYNGTNWVNLARLLSTLGDVVLTSPTTGQVLEYDAGLGKWKNVSAASISTTLAGDTDVLIASPANNEILRYVSSAGKWENASLDGVLTGVFGNGLPGQNLITDGAGAPSYGFSIKTWKDACAAVAVTALPSCTYSNGTAGVGATLTATANGQLIIDGVSTLTAGYRVLINGQASAVQNGIYDIVQLGDASHPFILRRSFDFDGNALTGSALSLGDTVAVYAGTLYAGTIWQFNSSTPSGGFVFGTSTNLWVIVGGTTVVLTTPGATPVTFNPTSPANGDVFVYDSGSGTVKNQRQHYDLGFSAVSGVLTASQKLGYHRFSKAVTIPANCGAYLGRASQAGGSANATASTVITIEKAATASPTSFSSVGTITIATGTVTPTFATSGGAAVSFAAGDVVRLTGPVSPDATLADFYATLVGFET